MLIHHPGYGLLAGLWILCMQGAGAESGSSVSISWDTVSSTIPLQPGSTASMSAFTSSTGIPLHSGSEPSSLRDTTTGSAPLYPGSGSSVSDNTSSTGIPLHSGSESSVSGNTTSPRSPLYFMNLWRTLGHQETIDYVMEEINGRPDLLADYELHAQHRYADREVGLALKEFIALYEKPPIKIAVMGPPISVQTMVVADLAKYYNLIELAVTSSALMSDKAMYPLFSRVKESTSLHNPAILRVLRHYGWRKVAKLVRNSGYITPTAQRLQIILNDDNITTLATPTYNGNDPAQQLRQIRDVGGKIILSFGGEYCTAYHLGMYGPRYQWLHWSARHNGFDRFQKGDRRGNCTIQQIRTMMDGMFLFSPISQFNLDDDVIGISGYSLQQARVRFAAWLEARNLTGPLDPRPLDPLVYDAVWAVSLAMNRSAANGEKLNEFTYGHREMARHIYANLLDVRFQGVSGKVAFDENGDRNSEVVISQVQGDSIRTVGVYSPFTRQISWTPEFPPVFPGGHPPRDSLTVVYADIHTSPVALYTVCALCAGGILACIGCIVFNVHFSELRLVKLSSPRINSMIALGCAMTYVSAILVGFDGLAHGPSVVMCNLKVWLLVFGFTLSFGGMFSKTWRVHVLFTNKKLTRKVVRDHHLFALVALLAVVDVIVLASWSWLHPRHWMTVLLPNQVEDEDAGVLRVSRVFICTSSHATYWTGAVSAYKALLLIFGMFFAWETRQVRVEALNDSKQIGVCVYNVMLTSAIAVPLVNLLSVSQVGISFGVTAAGIIICASSTLGLLFGAKMYLMVTRGAQVEDLAQLPFAASLRGSTLGAERGTTGTVAYSHSMQTVPEVPSMEGRAAHTSTRRDAH